MRVCYGLVGMTRGHAARALAIGQELLDRGHEVLFCTEGDAEELLSARFGKERVLKTSTPKYYLKNGRLSIWRTVFGNRKYLYGRRKLAKPLLAHLQEWKPDVTISDYEPLMWQASKVLKIPHVAVNSQEFFISSPLPKGLSLAHRIQAKAGGLIVRRFSPTADLRIVGKILVEKRPKSKAVFVGAILRKEFDNLTWQPQASISSSIHARCSNNRLQGSTESPSVNKGVARCLVSRHQWSKATIGLTINQPPKQDFSQRFVLRTLPSQHPETNSWRRRSFSASLC